jgi:hypothetical protein
MGFIWMNMEIGKGNLSVVCKYFYELMSYEVKKIEYITHVFITHVLLKIINLFVYDVRF